MALLGHPVVVGVSSPGGKGAGNAREVFGASDAVWPEGCFGPGTATGPATWASTSGRTWEWRTWYYAHEDWTPDQLEFLDRAFRQINNNLEIVEEYYDQDGVTKNGACHTNLLSGGSWTAGHLYVKPWDGVGCALNKVETFIGCASGFLIKLNENYINNAMAAFSAATRGEDTGESACVVADVAGTIVHEAAHICLGDEKLATLVNLFYAVRFAANHGWSHENCCGEELDTWDPGDWTLVKLNSRDEVQFQSTPFSGCR